MLKKLIVVSSALIFSVNSYGFLDSLNKAVKNIEESVSGAAQSNDSGNNSEHKKKQPKTSSSNTKKPDLGLKSGVFRKGYSEDVSDITDQLYQGRFSDVEALYASDLNFKRSASNNDASFSDENDSMGSSSSPSGPRISFKNHHALLHYTQHASLLVDTGKPAKDALVKARKIIEKTNNQGAITGGGFFSNIRKLGGAVTGKKDLAPYEMLGYEKVLMLNYQAIDYLLDGKDEAFNVSKLAISWQAEEREKFKIELAKRIKEAEESAASEESGGASFSKEKAKIVDALKKDYAKYHKYAEAAESAFVNPMGSYLSAVVMEFDAHQDNSSFDDAKREYIKAAELNGKSKVIKSAVNDFTKWDKKNGQVDKTKRLLHVIVSDGFMPEKKVSTRKLATPLGILNFQLPVMEPVGSRVNKIALVSSSGKTLSRFSVVADTEAMAMRHQKDSEDQQTVSAAITVIRSAIVQNTADQLAGGLGQFAGAALEDKVVSPDTRSWTNLPAKMYAARYMPPKNTKFVYVVSYDENGRQLAKKKLQLNNKHNFAYVRSANKVMNVRTSKLLWVN